MINTERIPSEPPIIAPITGSTKRPLWSVMIPAYNCSKYLEKTILSVLSQYPGPDKMQIEVVDDCSTDANLAELVGKIGKGVVKYYRQDQNRGHLRNFETCINRAQGELIHLLHGDDYVLDGFYTEIEHLFALKPAAGAAFTDFYFVNENNDILHTEEKILDEPGEIADAIGLIGVVQRIQTPAMVVKRSVYEALGSFYAVKCCEDWLMWTRIAANFPLLHSPKHLACYRVHTNNLTSDSFVTGQYIKDINTIFAINETYLPADRRKVIMKKARRHFAIYAAWIAHKVFHDYKNTNAAMNMANGALKMDVNKTTLFLAMKLYAKIAVNYKR